MDEEEDDNQRTRWYVGVCFFSKRVNTNKKKEKKKTEKNKKINKAKQTMKEAAMVLMFLRG